MDSFITIGIDPALTNTGIVAAYSDYSHQTSVCRLVTPPPRISPHERLQYIYRQTLDFLETMQGQLVVIEGYNYRGQNLAQLGEASGVIKLACLESGHPRILEVSPAEVKKFATGNSQASKEQVQEVYGRKNEHLADAAVLARLGQVYLTGISQKRHELEVVKRLKEGKPPARPKPPKLSVLPVLV